MISKQDTDHWRADHTCSFCGGLNPDVVLAEIREGRCTITPTDKSYKIYVEPGMRSAYFQHFSDWQGTEFTALYNDGVMKLGFPGHFYVKPFIWK